MAYVTKDFYLILSDGMFAGTTAETISFNEKLTRILSHGLLDSFPVPAEVVTGTFLRFKRGASRLFIAGSKIFMRP